MSHLISSGHLPSCFPKWRHYLPHRRLWGGAIKVERVVQSATLFSLLNLGKIWFFFRVFEGEFRCASLPWKVVALGTICMGGLIRVEDHLKWKDPEKREGPRKVREGTRGVWGILEEGLEDVTVLCRLLWKHRSWVGKEQIPGLFLKISWSESWVWFLSRVGPINAQRCTLLSPPLFLVRHFSCDSLCTLMKIIALCCLDTQNSGWCCRYRCTWHWEIHVFGEAVLGFLLLWLACIKLTLN